MDIRNLGHGAFLFPAGQNPINQVPQGDEPELITDNQKELGIPGDALSRASCPQENGIALPGSYSFNKLLDCPRLIACRLVRGLKIKIPFLHYTNIIIYRLEFVKAPRLNPGEPGQYTLGREVIMNFVMCCLILSSWTTFRGNDQRTGLVDGRGRFYQQAPTVLSAWIVHSSGNSVYGAPVFYDQDSDGKEDIYITSHSSYPAVTLYRGPGGSIIWNCIDNAGAYYSSPALLPINYDPYPEVFQGFDGSGGS